MQVIGTAGHVDHGKSTLVQRLTGIDPDRFAEEKRRGLTIDLGFAWLPLPSGREVGVVDVPGHERFVRNMLAGAGGITVCLFVVAANEGWMPQSAEHLAILDVLGVSHGVVALTKADTVDGETLELAAEEVRDHLAGTSLQGAPVVPCSAVTGAGLPELLAALDHAVAASPPPPDEDAPRLWVDRVFTIAGAGTVVTGTLARGGLATGDEVEVAPGGRRARIRTIQSHKKELASVGPGNRVALNLAGLERGGAERGDAIVKPGRWRATDRVDVRLRVLDLGGRDVALTEKGAYLFYAGSAETPLRLKLLGASKIAPGAEGFAQLHLASPLPLVRGDRFVIRDAGRVLTLGGGEVLDPLPAPARRTDATRPELLAQLAGADPSSALAALVRSTGGLDAAEAMHRSGASSPESPDVVALASFLVTPERRAELAAAVVEAVGAHHAARPLERGMPRELLKPVVPLDADAFDALLDGIPELAQEGALVRLTRHSVALDPEARARVLRRIEDGGFTPPLAHELDADRALLRALVESGDLVAVGDFYLTRAQAETARQKVKARIEESGGATVAEIRDLLGTTRKYAVPLCEWLDATGTTRRRGDVRVLGPRA